MSSRYVVILGIVSPPDPFQSLGIAITAAYPVSRPRRRFLRFSVRGMIVLVLVVAVWLGWVAWRARIQRQAYEAISKHSVMINYDMELNETNPWAPQWLVDLIGYDFFANVVSVTIGEAEDIVFVSSFNLLNDLDLSYTTITDSQLSHLKDLTTLRKLSLYNTRITDGGLAYVKKLNCINDLSLAFTKVTDIGLKDLNGLVDLQSLDLTETKVTDAGLVYLKGLTKLKFLDLRGTKVTDVGVKELQQAFRT